MVRDFHRVIGDETRAEILKREGRLPDSIFACVGGGSNAIGMFHAFIGDENVKLIGIEAGGRSLQLGEHAARFAGGAPGVLHGAKSYLLQDADGQAALTHSVSAGLDYVLIGPEHAWLHDRGRAEYTSCSDADALAAAKKLARTEGIIPALESAHAVHEAIRRAPVGTGQAVRRQSLRPRRQRHRHLSRKFSGAGRSRKVMQPTRIQKLFERTPQGKPRRADRLRHRGRSFARAHSRNRRGTGARRRRSDRTGRAFFRSHCRRSGDPARGRSRAGGGHHGSESSGHGAGDSQDVGDSDAAVHVFESGAALRAREARARRESRRVSTAACSPTSASKKPSPTSRPCARPSSIPFFSPPRLPPSAA